MSSLDILSFIVNAKKRQFSGQDSTLRHHKNSYDGPHYLSVYTKFIGMVRLAYIYFSYNINL